MIVPIYGKIFKKLNDKTFFFKSVKRRQLIFEEN